MNQAFEKFILSALTAAVVALGGWVYSTGSRVTAAEVSQSSIKDDVRVIRDDVREIRRAILGQ